MFEGPRSVLVPLGSALARLGGVLEAPWGVLEGILGLLGDVLARLGARKPEIIKNCNRFASPASPETKVER